MRARQLEIHGQPQEVGRHVVNAVPDEVLLPQPVEDVLVEMRNIGHTLVVGKDLEGAQVHSRLDLHRVNPCGCEFVRENHRMLLRGLGVKVIVRNGRRRVVEAILLGQEVVDGGATVTQDGMRLEKLLDDGETLPNTRVGCSLLIVFELKFVDNRL
jgi:hypothetical protein